MGDTHNGGSNHKNSLHDITRTMGHPTGPDRPANLPSDKATNMAPSNYLKTFMLDMSSDEESPPPTKPKTSFFYQDQVTADDIFPKHPAKRKRTSSTSSNSDADANPPRRQYSRNSGVETCSPRRQYSRNCSARTSRNNSEKSTKSGTVCGTFGNVSERTCYRPKFPSDDSDDFKDSVKSNSSRSSVNRSPSEQGVFSTRSNSSLSAERVHSNGAPRFGATYRSERTYGTDRTTNHPRFPSDSGPEDEIEDVKSAAPSSPEVESKPEAADTEGSTDDTRADEQTPGQSREPSPEPAPRVRPGRTAAVKAQDLIKSFAPKQYRTKDSIYQDDYYSDDSYDYGVPKYELDAALLKTLPQPLQIGYRFYTQLRNDSVLKQDLVPFLEPVNGSNEATKDYYKKIEKPMCLTKIEEKMSNLDYFSTPEIIGDIRLILENCYRYNGFEAWISKHACKIEMSLEQRITLLPYSMRGKCALSETNPNLTIYRDVCGRRTRVPRIFTGCSKSPIMIAMEEMALYRSKEVEILATQQSYRREAMLQERIVTLASCVSSCQDHNRICSSWELISSCLMICVCQEDFNIPFTVGAVELGLLYPRHSKYLAKLMINLSSTSKRIKELERQGNVSYEEWNREIARRVGYWYTVTSRRGVRQAQNVTGVTPQMFDLFGTYQSPLGSPPETSSSSSSEVNKAVVGGKLFHELSVAQRLTLLHSLCTSKVAMSARLQNCFLEYDAESLRPTHLGQDGLGNLYFHFPLWPEEVRVYVETCPSSKETAGNVVCVARSTDELHSITEQLRKTGLIEKLQEYRKKGGPGKRLLVSTAKTLVKKLESLNEELLQHKSHHLLVETTIYKELAQSMSEESSLEVEAAPPTPPRPDTPPPRDPESEETAQLETDHDLGSDTEHGVSEGDMVSEVESDVETKLKSGLSRSSDTEVKVEAEGGE